MLTCLCQCPAEAVKPSSVGGGAGDNSMACVPSGPGIVW